MQGHFIKWLCYFIENDFVIVFCQNEPFGKLPANYQQIKLSLKSIDIQLCFVQAMFVRQITGKLNYAHIGIYFISISTIVKFILLLFVNRCCFVINA
jgi:hypothetical protein